MSLQTSHVIQPSANNSLLTSSTAKPNYWKGYYEQIGQRYELKFHSFFLNGVGKIEGSGQDHVATFVISGTVYPNGDVTFTKQYIGKHALKYSGRISNSSLIDGSWEHVGYNTGKFHVERDNGLESQWGATGSQVWKTGSQAFQRTQGNHSQNVGASWTALGNGPTTQAACQKTQGNCPTTSGSCQKAQGNCPTTTQGACQTSQANCQKTQGNCPTTQGNCQKTQGNCATSQAGCQKTQQLNPNSGDYNSGKQNLGWNQGGGSQFGLDNSGSQGGSINPANLRQNIK